MKSLWQKIFGSAATSNEKAKSRLHFVLVQDRTGLGNTEMASFKEELVQVIERYFQIDADAFDITYKREGEETALVINSPVVVKTKKASIEIDEVAKASATEAASAPPA